MKNSGVMEKKKCLLYGCFIVIFAVLCITSGSFWFDEFCRVEDPIFGTIADVWKTALGFGQPGYMLWVTLWTKVVGTSEYLIRYSNIPFVVVQIFFAYKIIKKQKWQMEYIFLFFLHPMFVYYMDEATPYMAVYAFSLGLVYYVFFAENSDFKYAEISRAVRINTVFAIGVFFHFIFGFIAVLYIVHLVFLSFHNKLKLKHHLAVSCLYLIFYVPLLYLYVDGLFLRNNSTRTGFNLKNIAYVVYAFLGMSGLSLSRNDLRAGDFFRLTWWRVLLPVICCVSVILIVFLLYKEWKAVLQKYKSS
jgi:hypothetical protein